MWVADLQQQFITFNIYTLLDDSLEVSVEEAEHAVEGGPGGIVDLLPPDVTSDKSNVADCDTIKYIAYLTVQPCNMSLYSLYTHSSPKLITLQCCNNDHGQYNVETHPQTLLASPPGFSLLWSLPAVSTI